MHFITLPVKSPISSVSLFYFSLYYPFYVREALLSPDSTHKVTVGTTSCSEQRHPTSSLSLLRCLFSARWSLNPFKCPKEVSLCPQDNEFKIKLFYIQAVRNSENKHAMTWCPGNLPELGIAFSRCLGQQQEWKTCGLWDLTYFSLYDSWELSQRVCETKKYGSRASSVPGYCRGDPFAACSWLLFWERSFWSTLLNLGQCC